MQVSGEVQVRGSAGQGEVPAGPLGGGGLGPRAQRSEGH